VRRITFFVSSAENRDGGLSVLGQVGLGPIKEGDTFDFVHRQSTGEDFKVEVHVVEVSDTELGLGGTASVVLEDGDILAAELAE
jgi:hypothetical protein